VSGYQATGGKSEYEVALGALLRAAREGLGLSLGGVQEKSRGRWKASVLGTWERAERSVTADKLAGLAAFYGVPVSSLLPGEAEAVREAREQAEGSALAFAVKIAGAVGMSVDELLRRAS
jgi:transcriptional regulator with XRE-family HTH domain